MNMNFNEAAKRVNDTKFSVMVDGNIRVENAIIIYTNFAGNPTNLNPQGGKRTFGLCLNQEWADRLKDNWNVKVIELENGDRLYHTEIVVNDQSQYPPKLYTLTEFMGKKTMTELKPELYRKLDTDMIVSLDLEIHPYVHGRGGNPNATKGYLKNLWAQLQSVNDFGGKYAEYQMAEV